MRVTLKFVNELPIKSSYQTPNLLAKTCVQELICEVNQLSLWLELTSPKNGVDLSKTNYLACQAKLIA